MKQSEKQIENSILCFLEFLGIFVWKNQTVGIWDPSKKIYRKSNNRFHRKGVPDILGILDGKLLAIEVKALKGVVSPEQRVFITMINEQGGIAFVARSVQQCAIELSKFIPEESIKFALRKFTWPETFKEQ